MERRDKASFGKNYLRLLQVLSLFTCVDVDSVASSYRVDAVIFKMAKYYFMCPCEKTCLKNQWFKKIKQGLEKKSLGSFLNADYLLQTSYFFIFIFGF